MGVCFNTSNNQVKANQIEEIIEYIGYEDFGVLERCKTDNHGALKNRVYSMYNNPGGSSIGQYESESKEEIKNIKKDEIIDKSKEEKKENEEVVLKSAVKNEQSEEKNVNNVANDNNNVENKEVKKESKNDVNKLQEIKEEINENKKETNVVENNVIQENKEQPENNQEVEKSNKEEVINNNNDNQEVQNEVIKENKEENIKEEINNNCNNNNSFNQNYENVNNDNNNNNNQQDNQNVNPEIATTDNNNNNLNQPQVKVEVEIKQEIIEENEKNPLRAANNNIDNNANNNNVNNNNVNSNVNINDGVQNKSVDTFNKKVKLPSLNTIVSEKLLAEGAGNELLFISNLLKIEQISIKERVKYVERFCMITKDNFIIYDSKENYITIKKPLAVIPINSIINVVLFKLTKKVLSYDHFYIEFKIDTADNMDVYNQLTTFFINDNKENIIRQKETALLMFKTEEKMLAKKWYVLIKYLTDIKKNNIQNQNVSNS